MWSRTFLVCWFVATAYLCVCAPQNGFIFPDDEVENKASLPSASNGKSAQMCKKYAESVYYTVESLTGEISKVDTCVVVEPLITNGTPALPREFPHMALVGFPAVIKGGKKWSCGGSLISERFVLSAAHCNSLNKISPKWVRLGEYDYKSTADDDENNARPVDYEIIKIFEHPQYDAAKLYNDITLYKLNKNVVFNEYIRPICLHSEHQLPRSFYLISGWGHVEFGKPSTGPLLKGNVSYVPGNECGSLLKSPLEARLSEVKDNSMICAANFVNGTDTCQGDSGGPLQYPLAEPYCMYSQVGITSFGAKCGWNEGEPKYPAVYTRVSYFVPWIESIVWP